MHLPSNTTTVRSEGLAFSFDDGGSTTNCEFSAPANSTSKGSWVSLGTPSFSYEFIVINGRGISNSSTIFNIMDIGFGTAGNQAVVAENLYVPSQNNAYTQIIAYSLPLHIPSGRPLWLRIQGGANLSYQAGLVGFSHGIGGSSGYSRCVALHNATTNNGGQRIDCGSTANSFGAWTEIQASTTVDLSALMVVVDEGASNGTEQRWFVQVGYGSAGNEFAVMQTHVARANLTGVVSTCAGEQCGPVPVQIPLGSRIVARGMTITGTAGQRSPGVSIYGFV